MSAVYIDVFCNDAYNDGRQNIHAGGSAPAAHNKQHLVTNNNPLTHHDVRIAQGHDSNYAAHIHAHQH
jgi:hypothetical protein